MQTKKRARRGKRKKKVQNNEVPPGQGNKKSDTARERDSNERSGIENQKSELNKE